MSGRNFSLTDRLSSFVDRQVETGRHQNASEVVREALRRYEDDVACEEAHLDEIRAAAAEGIAAIERGDYVTVASRQDARALRGRIRARAGQHLEAEEREARREMKAKAR
jgi:antitoxin ParD1/3/4